MPGLTCYTAPGGQSIDGCTLARTRGHSPGPVGTRPSRPPPVVNSAAQQQARTAESADAVKKNKNVASQEATPSPLLTAGVVTITADILGEMIDTSKVKVATIVPLLNTTIQLAKITTALAEAMLLAQMIEETGGFIKEATVENGVEGIVIYNTRPDVPAVSKVKVNISKRIERYLHGVQVKAWRASKLEYEKAKAGFDKAQPGRNFDAAGTWKVAKLTDYVPGDEELAYWKKWYDVSSPDPHRSALAKSMKNVTPGDGLKYIGRGYIQLTWRCNYLDAGAFIGQNLEADPKLAAEPLNAAKITAWFWNRARCNKKASADTDQAFQAVTKAVNGGTVNIGRRKAAYTKVKAALLKQIPAAAVQAK